MAFPQLVGATTGFADAAFSFDINVPAGTQDGDVMFAVFGSNNAGATTWNAPAGWTKLYEIFNNGASFPTNGHVFMRVASSEPASYTFSLSSSTARNLQGGIVTYTGVAASPLGANSGGANSEALSATMPTPDITTLSADVLVLRIWQCSSITTLGSGDYIDPVSAGIAARERFQAFASSGPRAILLADEEQATPGATGVENASQNEVNAHNTFTISLKGSVPIEVVRPDAILLQTNDTKTLANLQRDVP